MDVKVTKSLRLFVFGFSTFILIVFSVVCLRIFTRQILIERMGMCNSFTKAVLFDAQALQDVQKKEIATEIDWQELYPFLKSESVDEIKPASGISRVKDCLVRLKNGFYPYVTNYLPFYRTMTELAGSYEKLILWKFSTSNEYNNVTIREGGTL